jgi:hypothetical protein
VGVEVWVVLAGDLGGMAGAGGTMREWRLEGGSCEREKSGLLQRFLAAY